jgi:hypothetical protein
MYTASDDTPVSVAFKTDANTTGNSSEFKGNDEESALLSIPVLRDDHQHHSTNNAAAANPSNANVDHNDDATAAVTNSARITRTPLPLSKRNRSLDGYDYDYNHHSTRTTRMRLPLSSESSSSNVMDCNANQMPFDHRKATLQFEKGYEGGHGAKLHCSHPSCKKDGVKNLWYCKHCNMAASKKTFHKKHLHPELIALNAEIPMPSLPTETEIPVPSLPTEIPMPKRDYEKKLANIK